MRNLTTVSPSSSIGLPISQQMGNCVSSQSQAGVAEKQAAANRGRNIVAFRKVNYIDQHNCIYLSIWIQRRWPSIETSDDTCQIGRGFCASAIPLALQPRKPLRIDYQESILTSFGQLSTPSTLLRNRVENIIV